MLSGRWSDETRNIGKSQGYHGLSIHDTTLDCKVNGKGTPAMMTCWHPTPRELDALMNGGHVVVQLLGLAHPPIAVFVSPEKLPVYDERMQVLLDALKPFAECFRTGKFDGLSVPDFHAASLAFNAADPDANHG